MMSLLHEVIDKLIDGGQTGVLRRRLFNLDARAYVELENLPEGKRGALFKMDRVEITNEIQSKEDGSWDQLVGASAWKFPSGEFPAKDADLGCQCEPEHVLTEYPDPHPTLYALTPVTVRAGVPTRVEIVGCGFVADATSVLLTPAAGAPVAAPLLGPVRGTFRCGRIDVLVNLAHSGGNGADTWTVQVAILDPNTDGFVINGNLSLQVAP